MRDTIELVHISDIRAGDTVEHKGKQVTVCAKDLTYDSFMGAKLFGDCHRLGHKPVRRVVFHRATDQKIEELVQ